MLSMLFVSMAEEPDKDPLHKDRLLSATELAILYSSTGIYILLHTYAGTTSKPACLAISGQAMVPSVVLI